MKKNILIFLFLSSVALGRDITLGTRIDSASYYGSKLKLKSTTFMLRTSVDFFPLELSYSTDFIGDHAVEINSPIFSTLESDGSYTNYVSLFIESFIYKLADQKHPASYETELLSKAYLRTDYHIAGVNGYFNLGMGFRGLLDMEGKPISNKAWLLYTLKKGFKFNIYYDFLVADLFYSYENMVPIQGKKANKDSNSHFGVGIWVNLVDVMSKLFS